MSPKCTQCRGAVSHVEGHANRQKRFHRPAAVQVAEFGEAPLDQLAEKVTPQGVKEATHDSGVSAQSAGALGVFHKSQFSAP